MLNDRSISNIKCAPCGNDLTMFWANSDKAAEAERQSKAEIDMKLNEPKGEMSIGVNSPRQAQTVSESNSIGNRQSTQRVTGQIAVGRKSLL